MKHVIKTLNPWFSDLWEGRKTFEIRVEDDRTYNVRDVLYQREFSAGRYTGRMVRCVVGDRTLLNEIVISFDVFKRDCNVVGLGLANVTLHEHWEPSCSE